MVLFMLMEAQLLNSTFRAYLQANPWIIAVLLWVLIWKALALWQAARKNQKIWFVALLIINTLGLLEIIYLAYYYFQDKKSARK